MYRGRPPHRGGYPPPFEGRGPPFGHASGRSYSPPSYREERGRPRSPYHQHGYHDRGPPSDSYRRSPPRRRYPSPGQGSHRGGEYWGSGPPREVREPGGFLQPWIQCLRQSNVDVPSCVYRGGEWGVCSGGVM